LGLRHIWGDALFGDGCAEDDGLEDTPNASANAGQQCNFSTNSCVDAPIDFPDMIENYMDYAQDQCMNLFTDDQVGIMRSMLETARSGLINDSVDPSSVNTIEHTVHVSVFPNPVVSSFAVQFVKEVAIANMKLINMSGQTVWSTTNSFKGNRVGVKGIDLNSGVYILQMSVNGSPLQKRVIIGN